MNDEEKTTALRQLANAVIDAYLNRDQQFTPTFRPGATGVLYLVRPKPEFDHPELRTGVMYYRADYEPAEKTREKKTKRTAKK